MFTDILDLTRVGIALWNVRSTRTSQGVCNEIMREEQTRRGRRRGKAVIMYLWVCGLRRGSPNSIRFPLNIAHSNGHHLRVVVAQRTESDGADGEWPTHQYKGGSKRQANVSAGMHEASPLAEFQSTYVLPHPATAPPRTHVPSRCPQEQHGDEENRGIKKGKILCVAVTRELSRARGVRCRRLRFGGRGWAGSPPRHARIHHHQGGWAAHIPWVVMS